MQKDPENNRRSFAKKALLWTLATSFPITDHATRIKIKDLKSPVVPKKIPFLKITLQTIALEIGCILTNEVLKKCGIRAGNPTFSKKIDLTEIEKIKLEGILRNDPKRIYKAIFSAVAIKGPFIEESFCRALPSIFANPTKTDWTIGSISTLIFSYLHNVVSEKDSDGQTKYQFKTDNIPASQAMIGCFYWYLHRNYGFVANQYSHSLHNGILACIAILGLNEEQIRIDAKKSNAYTMKHGAVLKEDALLYSMAPLLKKFLK